MRHVLSIVVAVMLTPLIYMAAGFSAIKFGDANEQGSIEIGSAALGLVAAFVAGGLYALLVMTRLSPAGPVLAGLIYLGITLWRLLDLDGFRSAVPGDLFGVDELLHVPAGYGTALLAVPLLFTVFSPRRWRPDDPAAVHPVRVSYEPTMYTPPSSAPSTEPPTLASGVTGPPPPTEPRPDEPT
jgi:hypothetical protein